MKETTSQLLKDAAQTLKDLEQEIIEEAVDQSMQYKSEVAHHGSDARHIIEQGFRFTHKMLISSVSTGQKNILEDQADWAVNRLPHDKVQLPNLIARLRRYRQTIINRLPEDQAKQVIPFLDVLITRIQDHLESD